jgi:hypothetical protein
MMVQMTLLLLSSTIALASFGPNVRIDHENLPNRTCLNCAIAIGPGAPSSQPIYVAFEDDSMMFVVQSNIMFQKSTDAGRTWLPTDLLIRRGENFASNPDITTDSDGNVYIVYEEHSHILCVRSSDGGATWSAPARVDDESSGGIGLFSIAADTVGNLFVAWNQVPGGISHVFSSVSTDKGETWSPRVRVDDDTLTEHGAHPEVFVQPGTNHYLVAATTYRWFEEIPYIRPCAYLYRSTDRGQTFEPGVQFDTFNWAAGTPHVVADRDHIICDYFGDGRFDGDTIVAEARTFYTQADSWGSPARVTNLDSLHALYLGGALALSGDGRVHTALMVCDTADWRYDVFYTSSSDYGVSWSDLELVNDDTTGDDYYPQIVADVTGHAYVVRTDVHRGEIWFSTNNPTGIADEPPQVSRGAKAHAITGHGGIEVEYQLPAAVCVRAALHDAIGRQVGVLDAGEQKPGTHRLSWDRDKEGRRLSAGAYFVLLDMGTEQSRLKAVVR